MYGAGVIVLVWYGCDTKGALGWLNLPGSSISKDYGVHPWQLQVAHSLDTHSVRLPFSEMNEKQFLSSIFKIHFLASWIQRMAK